MPSAEEWVYWFGGFAAFIIGSVLAFAMSLRLAEAQNKHRYLMLLATYVPTAAIYGAMALGQGDYVRADAVTVPIMIYSLYAATHGFFFAFLALSILPNYYGALLAGVLATGQQVALLLGARSTGSAIWYWFIWAGVFWVAESVLFLFYLRPQRSSSAEGDDDEAAMLAAQQERPMNSMSSDQSRVNDWLVRVLAVIGGALYLALYIVDPTWLDPVSSVVQAVFHLGVDDIVKLLIGLILLWFFKPVAEASIRNLQLGLGMESTGEAMGKFCAAEIQGASPAAAAARIQGINA